ncbi:hypothetical protein [Anaeromassilibacillus senegalensis]|uniref:Lipocalin-like domain-containing protein n=1 Tax=Anaeromassilibacillus senegalensis TaxID=1673717 RepID=A0ABS9CJB0_9FIRM|nr:hypothetical protein [Anaeromassilibacillus senegalensis]MCF2651217.1 hypothetical protein [Anaeromassilibacillus senegalensis]
MKRLIALLLVAVMCFSLAACGGDKETSNNNEPQTNNSETQQETADNSQEENADSAVNLVGTWEYTEANSVLVLNEDGTGEETSNGALTWKYDEASNTLFITFTENNWTEECTYFKDDDTIYVDQWTFSRVAE